MKKTLLAISLAAGVSPLFADSDTSQILIVRGTGNSTCGQYLEAAKHGRDASAPFEQWLAGYITARNQTDPAVLDYAGDIADAEAQAWLGKFCQTRLHAKYFEAADALLSDLARAGRVKRTTGK